jgi:hypothetical protein
VAVRYGSEVVQCSARHQESTGHPALTSSQGVYGRCLSPQLTRLTVSLLQAIASVEVVFASSLIAWNLLIALYSLLMLKQVKKRKVCTRLTSASPPGTIMCPRSATVVN